MSFRTLLFPLLLLCALFLSFRAFIDKEIEKNTQTIAFYNVENLFDTIDDPHKSDNEFLPHSVKAWNNEKYINKIEKLSEVITLLDQQTLTCIGLAEVENKTVVKDLLASKRLKKLSLDYIIEEGDDPRGIDVALVYNTKRFKPLFHKVLKPCQGEICLESRDILAVKGLWAKDTVWIYVNHWPSRRAGQENSEYKRLLLAHVLKKSVDSVLVKSPTSKIFVLGDFNDESSNASLQYLTKGGSLINLFNHESFKGQGSIKYKKEWLLYDQILCSSNLMQTESKRLSCIKESATIVNPDFLHYKSNIKNGPYRSYRGQMYYGGYSDHFPVYLKLSY